MRDEKTTILVKAIESSIDAGCSEADAIRELASFALANTHVIECDACRKLFLDACAKEAGHLSDEIGEARHLH
jgi:hypothetical protein